MVREKKSAERSPFQRIQKRQNLRSVNNIGKGSSNFKCLEKKNLHHLQGQNLYKAFSGRRKKIKESKEEQTQCKREQSMKSRRKVKGLVDDMCFFQLVILRFVVKSESESFANPSFHVFLSHLTLSEFCSNLSSFCGTGILQFLNHPPSLVFGGGVFPFNASHGIQTYNNQNWNLFRVFLCTTFFFCKHVLHLQVWLVIKARIPGKQICNPEQMRAKRIEKRKDNKVSFCDSETHMINFPAIQWLGKYLILPYI